MAKKVIRLTESKLHQIIAEAVKESLNEIGDTWTGQYMIGRHDAAGLKDRTNYTNDRILHFRNSEPYKTGRKIQDEWENADNSPSWAKRKKIKTYSQAKEDLDWYNKEYVETHNAVWDDITNKIRYFAFNNHHMASLVMDGEWKKAIAFFFQRNPKMKKLYDDNVVLYDKHAGKGGFYRDLREYVQYMLPEDLNS